jgi:hypothetical protein
MDKKKGIRQRKKSGFSERFLKTEKQLTVTALKKKYIAFARSMFIRKPPIAVLNQNTGWLIALSNRVISE